MPIPEGEVWLDLLDLPREVPNLGWAWEVLDSHERRRAERFVHPPDRDRFIARRAALRRRLGTLLDLPPQTICYDQGASGRLSLSPRQHIETLQFSTSSAGPVALFGFRYREDLGVDIEGVRRFPEFVLVAERWLSPAEQLTLAHAPPARRTALFFSYWTGLEARLKTTGLGLTAHRPGSEPQSVPGGQQLWQTHWEAKQPSADMTFRLAVAGPGPEPPIRWTVSETLQVGQLEPPG